MQKVNLNNPMEIRTAGIKALKEALGPVGMVRFLQQFESGSGDYTKEKQDCPDLTSEEIKEVEALLKKGRAPSSKFNL